MKNTLNKTIIQIIVGIVVVVAITWGSIALLSHRSNDYNSTTVTRRDLTEIVKADGSVTSDMSVTLAFNMQGRVSSVAANVGSTTYVGQLLASLDTGTLQASLTGAQADVLAAQARLARLQNGARPEEIAIYSQKYEDATNALVSAMKSAYLAMDNAIVSKADTLFTNGNSVNPNIMIQTQSDNEKRSIENERLVLRDSMISLNSILGTLTVSADGQVSTSSIAKARVAMSQNLMSAKQYLDHLSQITSNLSPGSSGQSQSTIDSERSLVNAASQQVSSAMTAELAADAAWSSAGDALVLERAGTATEDIQASEAALGKAQSVVQGLQSQIRQSYIVAPFVGVITDINVKVGEVYVPGISASKGVSMIGDGSFKVEVFVPETDVGKIKTGDPATVTFDAYGTSMPFGGHVTLVDPAETISKGIKSYKVVISFDDAKDTRIKSGLTANVTITTSLVKGALAVPSRAIITRGSDTIILVKAQGASAFVEKQITTGIVGSDGYIEVLTGLNEGDVIASFGLSQ